METNPYCPPTSPVNVPEATPLALWNPKAAVVWSFFCTPVFGSILLMKNWRALGEHEKAGKAMIWSVAMAALVLMSSSMVALNPFGGGFGRMSGLIVFALWYIACAREQIAYVAAKGAYTRRGWGKPLLLMLAASFALAIFMIVMLAVGFRASH